METPWLSEPASRTKTLSSFNSTPPEFTGRAVSSRKDAAVREESCATQTVSASWNATLPRPRILRPETLSVAP
eukprot:5274242-Ditylum_brightwellii.AAC.1